MWLHSPLIKRTLFKQIQILVKQKNNDEIIVRWKVLIIYLERKYHPKQMRWVGIW